MDLAVGCQRGSEVQAHAEFLELDRDSGKTSTRSCLENWKWKLTASEEAGVLSLGRHQVWLREDFEHILLLQRLDLRRQVYIRAKNKHVHKIAVLESGSAAS